MGSVETSACVIPEAARGGGGGIMASWCRVGGRGGSFQVSGFSIWRLPVDLRPGSLTWLWGCMPSQPGSWVLLFVLLFVYIRSLGRWPGSRTSNFVTYGSWRLATSDWCSYTAGPGMVLHNNKCFDKLKFKLNNLGPIPVYISSSSKSVQE